MEMSPMIDLCLFCSWAALVACRSHVLSLVYIECFKLSRRLCSDQKAHDSTTNEPQQHRDLHILQAVEYAEKAVIHAIEEEVDNLFHDISPHDDLPKNVQKTVREGVRKAQKSVAEDNQKRREWLDSKKNFSFEDYSQFIGM